jgi:hypothetical protein
VLQLGQDESLESATKAVPIQLGKKREFNWQDIEY